jgi:PBP1b-binding outer membrane lipoprotein LpoB
MKMKQLTKIALTALLFAGALFATGCEKQPEEEAADAIEEAGDAIRDATN